MKDGHSSVFLNLLSEWESKNTLCTGVLTEAFLNMNIDINTCRIRNNSCIQAYPLLQTSNICVNWRKLLIQEKSMEGVIWDCDIFELYCNTQYIYFDILKPQRWGLVSYLHVIEGSQVHDDVGVHLGDLDGSDGHTLGFTAGPVGSPWDSWASFSPDVVELTVLLDHFDARVADVRYGDFDCVAEVLRPLEAHNPWESPTVKTSGFGVLICFSVEFCVFYCCFIDSWDHYTLTCCSESIQTLERVSLLR